MTLPRPVRLLCLAAAVRRLGEVLPLLLVLYVDARTGSTAVTASALAAMAAGNLAGNLIGGWAADRIGTARTILVSQVCLLPGLVLLQTTAADAIVIGAVVLGLSNGLYRPALQAAMAAWVDSQVQMRDTFNLWFWSVHVGFIAGITTAGWLATYDYDLLLIMEVASATGFAALVLLTDGSQGPVREESAVDLVAQADGRSGLSPWSGTLRTDPLAWAMLALSVVFMLVYSQASSSLPLVMQADGINEQTYGVVLAVNGGLIVLLHPLIATRLARADAVWALAAGQLTLGIGFWITAGADAVLTYVLAVIVWSVGEALHSSTNSASVVGMTGSGGRGQYAGALGLASGLGATLGPVIGVAAVQADQATDLWIGCLVLSAAAAAAYLLLRPALTSRL